MNAASVMRPVSSSNNGFDSCRSAIATIALPSDSSEIPDDSMTPVNPSTNGEVRTPPKSLMIASTRFIAAGRGCTSRLRRGRGCASGTARLGARGSPSANSAWAPVASPDARRGYCSSSSSPAIHSSRPARTGHPPASYVVDRRGSSTAADASVPSTAAVMTSPSWPFAFRARNAISASPSSGSNQVETARTDSSLPRSNAPDRDVRRPRQSTSCSAPSFTGR